MAFEARRVQVGDQIDHTPASDVAAGEVVVQNGLLGVAVRDIASGKLGALAIEGIFEFTKVTGVGTSLSVGDLVFWDDAANNATSTSTDNTLIGPAIADAADGDDRVRVKLARA